MKIMKLGLALTCLAVFASSMLPAGAAGKTGAYMLTFMLGDVKIVSDGTTRTAVLHQSLGGGETIITGPKSMADLLMGKNGYMRIQEKSKISLASLKKAKGDPDLDMESGRVMVIKSKLAKGNRYEVKTRTNTASIRGTVFQVSDSGKESQLDVLFGSVLVNPVLNGIVQRQVGEVVEENQSLTLDQALVQDILKKKKKMTAKEMRREVRESLMKHVAEIRRSPEFQKLNDDLKKQLKEQIEKAKKELEEKGLDRKSLKKKKKKDLIREHLEGNK